MTAKHTPGPWEANELGFVTTYLGQVIADVSRPSFVSNKAHKAREKADARLIAAAPDLLAALSAIINDGVHCDVVPNLHTKAVAAIAKATGGTP